jgi:hypothetical protein
MLFSVSLKITIYPIPGIAVLGWTILPPLDSTFNAKSSADGTFMKGVSERSGLLRLAKPPSMPYLWHARVRLRKNPGKKFLAHLFKWITYLKIIRYYRI